MMDPFALSPHSPALISTEVWSYAALFIWEAMDRFQTRSYRAYWSWERKGFMLSGVFSTFVGLIASCASCADFLARYCLGLSGR